MPDLDPITLEQLQAMPNEVNSYVHVFQQAAHILQENFTSDLNLVIIKARSEQQYTVPVASEIAILIVGDGQEFELSNRDIMLRIQGDEPGWYSNIPICNTAQVNSNDIENENFQDEDTKLRRITMIQYYSYRLQIRQLESFVLHRSGRLFQQYIVDAYVCIKQNRLNYLKYNQKQIRAELYSGLQNALFVHDELPQNGSRIGYRIVLLSSFIGEEKSYYSADTLDQNSEMYDSTQENLYSIEFLNSL
ncbi:11975_t:CDS:2, partial [Acaulospora morrowiae]